MKPLNKINIKWSPGFAYAIGLLATDGNLSPDGRHVIFTSKDLELVNKFQKSLGCNFHVGIKANGIVKVKKYYVVQIGDVNFYRFLLTIGLMPKKSFIIGQVKVPKKYFFDFLRGDFDGDGSFFSYFDPRWKSSFMFYLSFCSASFKHIKWIRKSNNKLLNIKGHISKSESNSAYQLKYAKTEALKLIGKLYYNEDAVCLSRKRIKIEQAIALNNKLKAAVAK